MLLEEYGERVVAVEQRIRGRTFTAPLEHLKHTRWKRHALGKDGAINPNYYEMCAWQRLREGVRAGDIAVPQSRRYRAFEDDLLSRAEWEALKRQNETRLAVTDDPDAYLAETQETIAELLDQLPALLDEEDYLRTPSAQRWPPSTTSCCTILTPVIGERASPLPRMAYA